MERDRKHVYLSNLISEGSITRSNSGNNFVVLEYASTLKSSSPRAPDSSQCAAPSKQLTCKDKQSHKALSASLLCCYGPFLVNAL
jgi:hypothetical protein